jgi:ABC-2 type transport system ATP-binding protein
MDSLYTILAQSLFAHYPVVMAAEYAIHAEGLSKSFGKTRALNGLDLHVAEGSLLALLGPNGAGKTTAVRILTTLLKPDSGRATVAGFDVVKESDRIKPEIGLAGQSVAIDDYLTGRENLQMIGQLYHLRARDARHRANELLEQFDLADAGDRTAKTYSGGMRRRLDLAAALVALPPVLFLDEPTTGLDPRSRRQVWDMIDSLVDEGATILLTTQYLEEADELADRIAVVDSGKVIAEGTSNELKDQLGGDRIEIAVAKTADLTRAAEVARRYLSGDATVDDSQRRISGPSRNGTSELAALVRDLDAAGITIVDLQLRRPSLDDVFLTLTGHEAEQQPETPAGRWGRRR